MGKNEEGRQPAILRPSVEEQPLFAFNTDVLEKYL